MSKQLSLDEMLECLITLDDPMAPACQSILEAVGSMMSQIISAKLKVFSGAATFEGVAFGGTCSPFFPSFNGQACPEPLSNYDDGEWDDEVGPGVPGAHPSDQPPVAASFDDRSCP